MLQSGSLARSTSASERPSTAPNAQFSARIDTVISARTGTLTATGAKPTLQQLPGNFVVTSTSPLSRSATTNSGDSPSGMKSEYTSPARP